MHRRYEATRRSLKSGSAASNSDARSASVVGAVTSGEGILSSFWIRFTDERSRSMLESQTTQTELTTGTTRTARAEQAKRTSGQPAPTQARRGTVIVFGLGSRLLNPLMAKLAGRRYVRLFAVLQHRGRRSGHVYETPVVAQRTADGFVVPMPFGERTDWYRNLLAAGEGMIRWNGAAYHVVEPQMVEWAEARPAFHRLERVAVPLLGIKRFVRLRYAPADESRVA